MSDIDNGPKKRRKINVDSAKQNEQVLTDDDSSSDGNEEDDKEDNEHDNEEYNEETTEQIKESDQTSDVNFGLATLNSIQGLAWPLHLCRPCSEAI